MRCRFQAPGARHPRLRAPWYRRRANPARLAPGATPPASAARPIRREARRRGDCSCSPAGSHRLPGPQRRRPPDAAGRPRVVAPPPSAAAPSRPAAAIAPKPQLQPEIRRAPPPPPAVQAARPPPPAARVAPPPPPPRVAAPPPRVAAPPPPRMAAPSPPPPRMAAPPPRIAAPAPPPRMAAPPPRPAASGSSGGSQEVPAERSEMLIVLGRSHRCVAAPALIAGLAGPRKLALFPCFWLESGYTPRHLTRKHGSKGRPVAAGP